MKKLIILLLCISALLSCKNETKSEPVSDENIEKAAIQEEGVTLLKGNYIFYEDAAVLQTSSEIYGVFLTNKTQELNKLAEKYKSEPTDMVTVELKVKITNKKDNKILWDNKVDIVEIIDVKPPSKEENNVVKLGSE